MRNSLQAVLIGNIIGGNTGAYCTNQAYVQRLISCKSVNHARGAAYLGKWSDFSSTICNFNFDTQKAIPSIMIVLTLCLTSGFAMYAYYEHCDPYSAHLLERGDQLMPYLTTYVFQDYPGVAAIYVSGAFAGALSTVSSFIRYKFRELLKRLLCSCRLVSSRFIGRFDMYCIFFQLAGQYACQ